MQHDNEMNLCPEHDLQVPLIFTFKFPGAELWCPHCGYTTGAPFGYTKRVKDPDTDLLDQQRRWENIARPFLASNEYKNPFTGKTIEELEALYPERVKTLEQNIAEREARQKAKDNDDE
jgi:hypothetical protein